MFLTSTWWQRKPLVRGRSVIDIAGDDPTAEPWAWLGDTDRERADDVNARKERVMAELSKRGKVKQVFEHPDHPRLVRQATRSELGLAVCLGLRWSGSRVLSGNEFRRGVHVADVGDDIEVRWTDFRSDDPWLMLQKRRRPENPASRYVLATGNETMFRYWGWAYGREVMQPDNWKPDMPWPCWALANQALRPVPATKARKDAN